MSRNDMNFFSKGQIFTPLAMTCFMLTCYVIIPTQMSPEGIVRITKLLYNNLKISVYKINTLTKGLKKCQKLKSLLSQFFL